MDGTLADFEPDALDCNAFRMIGERWMVITAGTQKKFNMMTASWGGLGVLWGKSVTFCFVRPSRYTYGFIEHAEFYSLSFFPEKLRGALSYIGEHSGREVDKVAETGLTPVADPSGAIYFAQAQLVFVVRKIYFQDIDPTHFLDPDIEGNYPDGDYHRMYVGEIVRTLRR